MSETATTPTPETRECSGCKRKLLRTPENWYSDSYSSDGLARQCRDCHCARRRARTLKANGGNKRCAGCKKFFPRDAGHFRTRDHGYHSYCRPCESRIATEREAKRKKAVPVEVKLIVPNACTMKSAELREEQRKAQIGALIDRYKKRRDTRSEEYRELAAALQKSGPVQWNGEVWRWSAGDADITRHAPRKPAKASEFADPVAGHRGRDDTSWLSRSDLVEMPHF